MHKKNQVSLALTKNVTGHARATLFAFTTHCPRTWDLLCSCGNFIMASAKSVAQPAEPAETKVPDCDLLMEEYLQCASKMKVLCALSLCGG